MLQNIKKRNEGFTIIEVLIVLAIAGLILLIVFLAIPALQRNQRNTGRKEDAGRIVTAINDFVSNNQGALPATAGNMQAIYKDAGSLNQFTGITNANIGTTLQTANTATSQFELDSVANSATVTPPAETVNDLVLVTEATAGDPGYICAGGTATQTGASNSDAALLYTLETSTGNWIWGCAVAQ